MPDQYITNEDGQLVAYETAAQETRVPLDVESITTEYGRSETHHVDKQGLLSTFNRRKTLRGTALHDLSDFSGWTAGQGTVEPDTSKSRYGDESLHLVGNTDNQARAHYTFSSPQDWTNKHLSLAFKWASPTGGATYSFQVLLWDTNANWERREITVRNGQQGGGGWNFATAGYRDQSSTAPDLTAIEEIRIQSFDVAEAWIDAPMVHTATGSRGAVMFTFDDAYETDYSEAWDYMQRFGMRGVSFIMSNRINQSGRLSDSQMDEMHYDGWEFGLHPQRDDALPEMSLSEARTAIEEEMDILSDESRLFESNTIAYPFNDTDAETTELVSEYAELAFGGGNTAEPKSVPTPMYVGRLEPELGSVDMSDVEKAIDLAANRGLLTTLLFHEIGGSGYPVSDFQSIVDYVAAADVDVVTPTDVINGTA